MANIDSVNNSAANDPTINKICAELAAQRKQTDAVLGQTKKNYDNDESIDARRRSNSGYPHQTSKSYFPQFQKDSLSSGELVL